MQYSQDIADEICASLAQGKSLVTTCKEKAISYSNVFRWLGEHKDFADNYARARDAQADYLAEEILEHADDKLTDPQRSRLQIDARKWYAGKMKPKKYGDRTDGELTIKKKFEDMTDEELLAVARAKGIAVERVGSANSTGEQE